LTLYSNIFSKGSGIIHTEKQSIVISVYEFLKHQCKYFGIAIKNDFRVYQLSQKAETSTKEILSIIESNDNHVSLTQLEDCGDLVGYSKKELKAITPGDYVSAAYYKDIDEDVAQIILQEIIDGRQLQSDEWVNDNMINIYFNYILQPMAENGSKSIVLIQTYFFQRLYMDNKVPGTTQYSTIAEQAGFKETKHYLLEVYKSQFENSTLFKRIIQYDFEYDGRLFTCDKMFYDEGSRLKFLLQRSGKKGDN